MKRRLFVGATHFSSRLSEITVAKMRAKAGELATDRGPPTEVIAWGEQEKAQREGTD